MAGETKEAGLFGKRRDLVLEISEDVYLVARPEVARQGAHPHVALALDREVDELSARGRPVYRLPPTYRDGVCGKWVFACRVIAVERASDGHLGRFFIREVAARSPLVVRVVRGDHYVRPSVDTSHLVEEIVRSISRDVDKIAGRGGTFFAANLDKARAAQNEVVLGGSVVCMADRPKRIAVQVR
jgi:hypothetical protein